WPHSGRASPGARAGRSSRHHAAVDARTAAAGAAAGRQFTEGDVAVTIVSVTLLVPYEVVHPIGVGGMGEVYKARDTRLDRTVALKVLPSAFATDADRRVALRACGA